MNINKLDKIGVGLSSVCLVHCLLLPVLLATLPFMSFLAFMKHPITEGLMIVFAILNAIITVTFGFKKHNNFIVPAIFFSGSILLGLFFFANEFIHHNEWIILIGAALIGVGHLFNKSLCKSCPTCKTHE